MLIWVLRIIAICAIVYSMAAILYLIILWIYDWWKWG